MIRGLLYHILLATFFVFFSNQTQAQLLVSSVPTPTQLVTNTLLGPGVTAANITYSGGATARGTFNCGGACNVGLSNGVLLTSGAVANAIGPNNSTGAGTSTGAGSDIDLNGLLPAGSNPQDAAVLQFDFTVVTDSLSFRYVWASEEYHDYVNTNCNDVFGFFISGPGIVGKKNIALIPGTATPISINNVNNGWAAGGTSPSGPCTNCAVFRDNTGGTTVQYDGMTTVLTATTEVCPCEVYRVKLAVQDFCDGAFDSGVFLEGNSFQSRGEIPVLASSGNYTQVADTLYLCPGDSVQLSVNACRAPLWSTGDTTLSIWVTQPGVYYTSIANPNFSCFAFSAIVYIQFTNSVATVNASGPLSFCPGDSVTLTATPGVSYLWSNGATSQSITILNPGTFQCTVSYGGTCSGTSNIVNVAHLSGLTLAVAASGPLTFCQGNSVTLTASSPSVLWSTGAVTQSITVNASGTYTANPTAAGFCPSPTSTTVVVNANPTVTINGTASICQGASSTLSISASFSQYNWSSGQSTASISVGTSGIYTVTVSDANACTATNTFNLTVNSNPTPAISGVFGFCQGASSVISTGIYSSYTWSNGSSLSSTNVSLPGTYTVTVTSANGCTGSISQLITVFTPPLPSITGITSICQGANANISASPAGMSYLWSNGSTANSIQPSVASTYTVTVTDGNGCSGTAAQVVSVNNNPIPTITGNLSACQGLSSTLGIGSAYSSYLWSNGNTSATISVNTSGNYSVIVSDANGCTGTTNVNFTSLPFTQATISGPVGFCIGNNAVLDAGTGYSNYQWSNSTSGQQATVTNGGAYTVTVTAANGCTGTSNYNITQWPLPIAQISGVTAICQGAAANLIAGPAGINYQWSTGSNASSIQPTTSGIYTLTVTDLNGCINSITQNVNVNANPIPVITGDFTVCQGDLGLMDLGSTPGLTYTWSNGGISSSIQPTVGGSYSVVVTDVNGCTGTTSQSLTVNALPTAIINGLPAFCTGDQVTLNAAGTFVSYQWSNGINTQQNIISSGGNYLLTVTDNNGCIDTTNFTVTENPLPQPQINNADICDGNSTTLQPGTFTSYVWSNGSVNSSINVNSSGTFTVTVTDGNGCINSITAQVIVHLNPTPTIIGQDEICDGAFSVLSLNSNFSQYQWSTGVSSSTATLGTSGNYSVIVTDAFGCTGIALFDLQVHPLPLVIITGDLDKCEGTNTTLQTTPGQGTYSWSNGSTDPTITVSLGGIYTVTVTTDKGCTKSLGVVFNVHPIPIAAYDPQQNITCEEIRIKFQNTSINEAGSTYMWDFGDGGTATDRSPSHAYALPGEYNTSLIVTSPWGCIDDESILVSVIIPPFPIAEFNPSTKLVSIFNSEVNFSNSSSFSTRYVWNFGDGLSSSEENPVHVFDKVGTNKIKLIAFNGANCFDEFESELEVAPFFIPNAFSPNNDGRNDVFFDGTPVLNVQSFDIIIFNRWGQNVYSADSFFKPWDGFMSNGNPSPEGLYTYKIKIVSIKGKHYEFTGSFSLLR